MATILVSIVVALLAFAAMAIGIMMGRQPIKGSCGGMSAMAGDTTCEMCGGNPSKCPETTSRPGNASPPGIYDPTEKR